MDARCPLCNRDEPRLLREWPHWSARLHRNQTLLGACLVALRRHAEAVPEVRPWEWEDLRAAVVQVHRVLDDAFSPDHVNLAFLGNRDRHVHLLVLPRYAGLRRFAGIAFRDRRFGDHFETSTSRRLAEPVERALVERLRAALA